MVSPFAFRGRIINSVAHSIKRDTPRIIILINIRRPIRLVLARDCCSIKCEAEVGFKFQIGRPRRKGIASSPPFHPPKSIHPVQWQFSFIKNCESRGGEFFASIFSSLLPVRINESRIHPEGWNNSFPFSPVFHRVYNCLLRPQRYIFSLSFYESLDIYILNKWILQISGKIVGKFW